MKRGLVGMLAFGALALAGISLGAASFSDPAGDDNAAPDITSVTVTETSADALTVTVSVSNHPTLPENAWFNLWFDLDSNRDTGVVGSDALVRYLASGVVEFRVAQGSDLVQQPATGVTGTYEAGILTVTLPKSSLGVADALGILVVSGRRQQLGAGAFIASDFAPDSGHYRWAPGTTAPFTDPTNDHEAAPDITSVRVSDAKDGWIRFAITTPNYETLRGQTLIALSIDADNRLATGEDGVDVVIPNIAGEVQLQR
ncbi:MAG TPA: hypothetical protein VK926_05925, partial [Gaiellaceae bacterium]|nr:hypothetical protein [Gaiellaceae bacterium]